MDKNEKLFRKISKKDSNALETTIENLLNKKTKNLNIEKIKNSNLYRIRKRNFRIIFHYNNKKIPVIDSIRVRSEKTYKNI